MAICLSETSEMQKLFLGDFDPVKIKSGTITFEQITSDLKLAALLYDRILIPSAYLWQSDLVGDKILYFQDFISSNILTPTVRADDRDLQDRFEKRLEETNKFKDPETLARTPALTGELTTPAQWKPLKLLQDRNNFIYLDEQSVSACLRQLWEKDLYYTWAFDVDAESLGVYIYEAFPCEEANALINQLRLGKDLEYVSRTTLIHLAQHVFDCTVGAGKWDQGKVERRISWLYLFATAIAADCDLYVHGFNASYSPVYANLELYLHTLESVGITQRMLRTLSVADVVTIRHAKEYQAFLETYKSLLNDTKIITEAQVSQLISQLSQRAELPWYQKAVPKLRKFRDLCMGIATGLLVNYLGGTPLSFPIAGAFGASVGVLGVSPILDRISSVNRNLSVSDFKAYMIQNFSKAP